MSITTAEPYYLLLLSLKLLSQWTFAREGLTVTAKIVLYKREHATLQIEYKISELKTSSLRLEFVLKMFFRMASCLVG